MYIVTVVPRGTVLADVQMNSLMLETLCCGLAADVAELHTLPLHHTKKMAPFITGG